MAYSSIRSFVLKKVAGKRAIGSYKNNKMECDVVYCGYPDLFPSEIFRFLRHELFLKKKFNGFNSKNCI